MKINRKKAQQICLKEYSDNNGNLVVIEGNTDIPFNIARIFYIYGSSSDTVRGKHANKNSEFVLINIKGNSKVKIDYGGYSEVFELIEPYQGVYIPKMLWKEMYGFTEDSVLLVLSNEKYDSEEYIKNYDEYLTSLVNYEEEIK